MLRLKNVLSSGSHNQDEMHKSTSLATATDSSWWKSSKRGGSQALPGMIFAQVCSRLDSFPKCLSPEPNNSTATTAE